MVKRCNKALKPNPFIAERDPRTGKWMAIKSNFEAIRGDYAALLGC